MNKRGQEILMSRAKRAPLLYVTKPWARQAGPVKAQRGSASKCQDQEGLVLYWVGLNSTQRP